MGTVKARSKNSRADGSLESDEIGGSTIQGEEVVELIVNNTRPGSSLWPGYPYVDEPTASMARHARSWDRIQRLRIALANSGQASEAGIADIKRAEDRESRLATGALQRHVLWEWLEKYKGLRGVTTCLIMGLIRDPRRFPGQKCNQGHYLPAAFEIGAPCPVQVADGVEIEKEVDLTETVRGSVSKQFSGCGAPILASRPTTGVRALWRYFGLHVVDGHAARKRRGQQADFTPRGKALLLAPDTGLAAQIVRHQCEPWIDIYYKQKERLIEVQREIPIVGRGQVAASTETEHESITPSGIRGQDEVASTVQGHESEHPSGTRPLIAIDRLARKIAAKAFLGDLLTAWKDCL